MSGNAIIGQSGGPTAVINASLIGAVDAALKAKGKIANIYGMRFGAEGFMQDLLVDLGRQPRKVLDGIRTTPSSALGSCRLKLKDEHFPQMLAQFKKYGIRYFFLIGGNDTMDTIHRVEAWCRTQGYDLTGVGIPKTVDNDLFGTDHTPGYGSAATYVARSVAQEGLLARDMQRVDPLVVFQTVGRSAGWLPAAAALAKRDEHDAPHLIYMPERPFDMEQCVDDVARSIERHKFCSIVCGEGITYADGTPVSASRTTDKFANIEFGAAGGTSAAMMIHRVVCDRLKIRGEFEVPESLQMCAGDRVSELDRKEAYLCGQQAVRLALKGVSGVMVTLVRPKGTYRTTLGTIPLHEVAVHARPMPDAYINAAGNFPTRAFLDYARPLIAPLGEATSLKPLAPRPAAGSRKSEVGSRKDR
jgi:6-phosphofructokinase 1